MGLVLLMLILSVSGGGQLPPPPPPCGGPGQLPCPPAVTVTPGRFDGPGLFDLTLIVINATLTRTSPIICDNHVIISPSGSSFILFGNQENTPALIEIPPDISQGIVTCSVPTSAGNFSFNILIGPPPVKGPPPPPPITIFPHEGATPKRTVRVRAILTNTMETAFMVKAIMSNGCEVRRVRPQLPQVLAPFQSKAIRVSLRCRKGGAAWMLSVDAEQLSVSRMALQAFDELGLAQRSNGFIFVPQSSGVEGLKLELFDLSGRKVFDSGFILGRGLDNVQGHRLANGVYLYVITASDGTKQLGKFVVLR